MPNRRISTLRMYQVCLRDTAADKRLTYRVPSLAKLGQAALLICLFTDGAQISWDFREINDNDFLDVDGAETVGSLRPACREPPASA